MKWEYKRIEVGDEYVYKIVEMLQDEGKNRWELCLKLQGFLILKREILESKPSTEVIKNPDRSSKEDV